MNNEHINHFQIAHLRRLMTKNGISVIAESEDDVGRYFGMWAIGERTGSNGDDLENWHDQEAANVSRRLLAEASAKLEERRQRFAAIMADASSKMAEGAVVGFWPSNEITTNILMQQAPDIDVERLRLFDIDREKHRIDWCSLGRIVQQPEPAAVSACRQIYLCSPSRNEEIAESIAAMQLDQVAISKIPFS